MALIQDGKCPYLNEMVRGTQICLKYEFVLLFPAAWQRDGWINCKSVHVCQFLDTYDMINFTVRFARPPTVPTYLVKHSRCSCKGIFFMRLIFKSVDCE